MLRNDVLGILLH